VTSVVPSKYCAPLSTSYISSGPKDLAVACSTL